MNILHSITSKLKIFEWGLNCIDIKFLLCTNDPNDFRYKTPISIANGDKFSSGWYMIEINLSLQTPKTLAIIHAIPKSSPTAKISFELPILSLRNQKRLIYLQESSELSIEIPVDNFYYEFKTFLLKRVSKRFAHSRILKKLKSSHPRYKKTSITHEEYLKIDFLLPQKLWLDYCEIFKETAAIFPYKRWIERIEGPTEDSNSISKKIVKLLTKKPLISILMPVFNTNPEWLEAAINSVVNQTYENWQLCIADDASSDTRVKILLANFAASDLRINLVTRDVNGHISEASNSALGLANGEWIGLLDHDDLLSKDALLWVALAIIENPDIDLIYSDEDKIDCKGNRSYPYLKCDWNLDLFYSQNMFSHFGIYRTALARQVGAFKKGFEGSQDYDLALRCVENTIPSKIYHIPRVLYHWRIHANSTSLSSESKPYAILAAERAINAHLTRKKINGHAESVGHGYRVRYKLPNDAPLITLIIPTKNNYRLLERCVNSVLEKTLYKNYEIIIVDNGSDDVTTLQYLEKLTLNPLIRVLRDSRPFNYSALNNAAVKVAQGEIIGLINNDIEVINADWLSEMVSHALRPGVAAVGARLWYSDDTLQHAGVVLGIHGIAGHVHRFLPRHDVGYCQRASLVQSFSAVTAACLVVRKSIYEELGGLNETELQVACNDVDFCLRAREAGYKNIWTPYAELYHHESSSRGFDDTPEKQARAAKEVAYMKQRWGDALLNDPAYSPNLTLDNEDFGLAWPPRVPSLDEVLNAMEQADQASALSPTPTLQ